VYSKLNCGLHNLLFNPCEKTVDELDNPMKESGGSTDSCNVYEVQLKRG
jgi:hypothetical protein